MLLQGVSCSLCVPGKSDSLMLLAWHAGGERYLDTREGSLYWWQLHLLDVYLVLFIGLVLVGSALLGMVYLLSKAARRMGGHAHQE